MIAINTCLILGQFFRHAIIADFAGVFTLSNEPVHLQERENNFVCRHAHCSKGPQ